MTYQTAKPEASDFLSQSVTDIQQNFSVANTIMAIDHYPFDNISAVKGYHKQVHMPELAAAPGTGANIGALYTKEAQAITNLFWQQENGTEVQLTNISPSNANPGYTYLPGGILIQWGLVLGIGASGSVTFPIEFKLAGVSNVPYCIQLQLSRNSGNQTLNVDSNTLPTSTGFNYLSSSGGSAMYWLAIGPKS